MSMVELNDGQLRKARRVIAEAVGEEAAALMLDDEVRAELDARYAVFCPPRFADESLVLMERETYLRTGDRIIVLTGDREESEDRAPRA